MSQKENNLQQVVENPLSKKVNKILSFEVDQVRMILFCLKYF